MKKNHPPKRKRCNHQNAMLAKRCKLNVNQQNEEFISKEELHKRNGIAEGKMTTLLCTCNLFFKGIIIHGHSRSIRQHGHAMIAFHKQDGTSCLEQGTLVGYENSSIGYTASHRNRNQSFTGTWNNMRGEDL